MDNYKVEKLLGQGAFGKVELVSHLNTGEFYAMKTIPVTHLVFTELAVLRRLQSICNAHIICLKHHLIIRPNMYLFTDYVIGYNLQDFDKSKIDKKFAVNYLRQLLPTLEKIHGKGVAHRDIKPGNIIFNPATWNFTLVDFGLASTMRTRAFNGSTGFFSKRFIEKCKNEEFLEMEDMYKNDIYALGVTLYILLNGMRPYPLKVAETKCRIEGNFSKIHPWQWTLDMDVIDIVNIMLQGEYDATYIIDLFPEFFSGDNLEKKIEGLTID